MYNTIFTKVVDMDTKNTYNASPEGIENGVSETINQEEIKENLSEQLAWKEQFLRVSADFQNFKKRLEKEQADLAVRAQVKVVEKIFPLLDDLSRALNARAGLELNEQARSWSDGFEIIDKNLKKVFHDLRIEEIDCSGFFDPSFHEALMNVVSPDHKTGQIVSVLAKGYKIGNYVIRPAQVSVAT